MSLKKKEKKQINIPHVVYIIAFIIICLIIMIKLNDVSIYNYHV